MKKFKLKKQGFTLVELMIVVVIVSMLAAIAIPSYTEFVKRGKVAEATGALQRIKIKSDIYYGERRSYTNYCSSNSYNGIKNAMKYFSLTCAETATTLQLTATGVNDMAGYEYKVDETGNKESTIDGNNNACWTLKPNESC